MPTEEANKQIVRRFYEAFLNTGNLENVAEVVANDFVDHNGYYPGIPPGLEGFKQMFAMSFKAFPDLHFTIHDIFAEGNKVVSRETMQGTHKGEFMGVPASGKTFSVNAINILYIENKKIQERWGVFEDLSMLQQLGILEPLG